MSTSATGTSSSAPASTRGSTPYVMTARLTLLLIAVQFALAGLGAFRGLNGRDTQDTWWSPHIMVGYAIGLLTLVVLVMALVQRLGRMLVTWTAVVAVLTLIGQPLLAALGDQASPWFGAVHALDGLAIAAILGVLSAQVAARRPAGRGSQSQS